MRLLAVFAVLAAGMIVPVVQAADPILIRFAHVTQEDSPKGQGALLLQRLAHERLGGRVRVEVYPRSLKFNDNEVLMALLLGDVELAAPSFPKFRGFTRRLQVFDLPFLFEDDEAVRRFQDGPLGRELLASMESKGIKGLAWWANGMRAMSANRPLRRPEDVKGLRFRIEPSAVIAAQYRALGAATVPMPFSQVGEALRMRLVTGQENAWSNIAGNGFHAFHKYFTELGHSYLGYMLVTSGAFWAGLPDDVRTTLDQIIAEVTVQVNHIAREQARTRRAEVIESGRIELISPRDEDRAAWRATLEPLRQQFEEQIGAETIAAAQRANRP